MKAKRRLEILEAFASSKPTEFDGFAILYQMQHPEQTPTVSTEPIIAVDEPVSRRSKPSAAPEVAEEEQAVEPASAAE